MKRISSVRDPSDVALEHAREDLRDRRWARRRQQIIVVVLAVGLICGTDSAPTRFAYDLWHWFG